MNATLEFLKHTDNDDGCDECNNRFQQIFNRVLFAFDRRQKILSKDEAFDNVTYGKCMTKEQFVARKQASINSMIREKIATSGITDTDFDKYFLLLPFNDTEEHCADEIFEPFRNNGFTIVKISEQIDILNGMYVYILSWMENSKKISESC